eukprot:GEMP01015078.1.p1 GENE.GEMP01015078.1~~GEMP01015078.1.p1  ORF type:complete len:346 (+),score=63.84 GEMP01015078.1:179-1216(+)
MPTAVAQTRDDIDLIVEQSADLHAATDKSLTQLQEMIDESLNVHTCLHHQKLDKIFKMLREIRGRQVSLDQQVDDILREEGLIEDEDSLESNGPASFPTTEISLKCSWKNAVDEDQEIAFWSRQFPWQETQNGAHMATSAGKESPLENVDMSNAFDSRDQFLRWCKWFSGEVHNAAQTLPQHYVHIPTLSFERNSLYNGCIFELTQLLIHLAVTNQLRVDKLVLCSNELDDSCINHIMEILKYQPEAWPIKELDLSKNNITDDGFEQFLVFLANFGRYPHEAEQEGVFKPLLLNLKNNSSYNISIVLARTEENSGLRWVSDSIRRLRRKKINRLTSKLAPHVLVI